MFAGRQSRERSRHFDAGRRLGQDEGPELAPGRVLDHRCDRGIRCDGCGRAVGADAVVHAVVVARGARREYHRGSREREMPVHGVNLRRGFMETWCETAARRLTG